MPKFSLRTLLLLIGLAAFLLAAANKEKYALSAVLSALGVGILIYGIFCQIVDLAKARSNWNDATFAEKNGWRLAIAVRIAIVSGLIFATTGPKFELGVAMPWNWDEFVAPWFILSQTLRPLMLTSALSLAPWNWRDPPTNGRTVTLRRVALAAAMAWVATIAWAEQTLLPPLVHSAIQGVVAAQPLSMRHNMPIASPIETEPMCSGAKAAYLAAALSLGAVMLLFKMFSVKSRLLGFALGLTALLLLGGCGYLIYVLHHDLIPKSSPFILVEGVYASPPRLVSIAIFLLLIGGLTSYWRQLRNPVPRSIPWRSGSSSYVHESRGFLEFFIFTQILLQLHFWTSLVKCLIANLWDPSQTHFYELRTFLFSIGDIGIQFAPLILAVAGLLQHIRHTDSNTDPTPPPFSPRRFLIETPLFAAGAYCLAESLLWSGFFYQIT